MKDQKKDNELEVGTSNHGDNSERPQNRLRTGVPAVPGGEATRFKKGQSGNPGGRPKTGALTRALRNLLEQPMPGDRQMRTYAQAIAERLAELAIKGHLGAVREIGDRAEGRAGPAITIDNAEEEVPHCSKPHLDEDAHIADQEPAEHDN